MKKKIKKTVFQIAAVAIGLLIMFPVIYALFISFMKPAQILSLPPSFFPSEWTFENYRTALTTTTLGKYMINSLIIAGSSSAIRIVIACLAAFGFSFYSFRGRNVLFMLCLGTVMIPADVVLVSNYKTISLLGLVSSYLGMMSVFLVSAMNIFVIRQNFLTFSKDLKEASHIDGCGNLHFFMRILLPNSLPVLTTVFISSFISVWNTYLWPLLVNNNPAKHTVQVGVTMLNFTEGNVYGPIMAASILVMLPMVSIFLIFRRQIVSGIMGGSVKG